MYMESTVHHRLRQLLGHLAELARLVGEPDGYDILEVVAYARPGQDGFGGGLIVGDHPDQRLRDVTLAGDALDVHTVVPKEFAHLGQLTWLVLDEDIEFLQEFQSSAYLCPELVKKNSGGRLRAPTD